MKPTIENLWNGNIVSSENCGAGNPEIEELIKLMDRNMTDLTKELNEHQKATLEKYIDCTDEYVSLITSQAFCDGFCLASKLLAEAMA